MTLLTWLQMEYPELKFYEVQEGIFKNYATRNWNEDSLGPAATFFKDKKVWWFDFFKFPKLIKIGTDRDFQIVLSEIQNLSLEGLKKYFEEPLEAEPEEYP